MNRLFSLTVLVLATSLVAPPAAAAIPAATAADERVATELANWSMSLDERLIDFYQDDATGPLAPPSAAMADWGGDARAMVGQAAAATDRPFPFAAGALRARVQQAVAVELSKAVLAGDVRRAQSLRVALALPRGVSSAEGALLLQTLNPANRGQIAQALVREAITWQTTRVRQLLDDASRTCKATAEMPGRLQERLGEAMTLADLPPSLASAAGLAGSIPPSAELPQLLAQIRVAPWSAVTAPLATLRRELEERLPSLLTEQERNRRERLLLKLVKIIPQEYSAGVRDGQVVVPLEYREAAAFTQQSRQILGELAPLWLADKIKNLAPVVDAIERLLEQADAQIAAKQPAAAVEATLAEAADLLTNQVGVSLGRSGSTADIVDEVMLETRSLLSQSLAAALRGEWANAERLRVEAYTTYDPELEARLMPRDPQLAVDIERLLLDGVDEPGVKSLLDARASAADLEAGYARVSVALEKAAALLKSGISPTAAAINAASVVLREGLEGLLVIVAIFAGLRGAENARRRRLFWIGIAASLVATAATWVLSQTLLTSLKAHGEVIAAVTGFLAIGVLLLITNWLFHQVYWQKWVSTLKAQATGENPWQLMTAGFLVGYREGFETVLFLQTLVLDAGGTPVSIGVAVGCVALFLLGIAALYVGLKLPYFKILLLTAFLIGVVLITFVGGTIRASQTVGWLPVHRLIPGSWPAWLGTWFGIYNTVESVVGQVATVLLVVGTWRIAKWQAKRKVAKRRAAFAANAAGRAEAACVAGNQGAGPISGCDPSACGPACDPADGERTRTPVLVQLGRT